MKTKLLFALGLLIVLLLGCTVQNDSQALGKFTALEQKYFVTNGYISNPERMNEYASALAELKAKTTGGPAKIIEAEVFSVNAFNYLNQTIIASTTITPQTKCFSKEIMSAIKLINIANENATKAVSLIQNLSDAEKKSLRANQLETVQGYATQIAQIKTYFTTKCGTK